MTDTSLTDSQDAAWASFKTPLKHMALQTFCMDAERLLRINPYLEFKQFQSIGDNRFRVQGRNISNDPPFDFEYELQIEPLPDGVKLSYNGGIKASTTFKVEDEPEGSKLTIVDDYSSVSEEERQSRNNEVDKSITKWAEDLQTYLTHWKRWCWFVPWRWYMRYVWQPMKPTARRITYMLLWISVVEVALIGLGVAIYFTEYS